MEKTPTRGGAREGAGRKKGEATTTATFRINTAALLAMKLHHGKQLNAQVNHFIVHEAKLLKEAADQAAKDLKPGKNKLKPLRPPREAELPELSTDLNP